MLVLSPYPADSVVLPEICVIFLQKVHITKTCNSVKLIETCIPYGNSKLTPWKLPRHTRSTNHRYNIHSGVHSPGAHRCRRVPWLLGNPKNVAWRGTSLHLTWPCAPFTGRVLSGWSSCAHNQGLSLRMSDLTRKPIMLFVGHRRMPIRLCGCPLLNGRDQRPRRSRSRSLDYPQQCLRWQHFLDTVR